MMRGKALFVGKTDGSKARKALCLLLYLAWIMALWALFNYPLLMGGDRLSPYGDGGLILYIIVRNIQKLSRLDFSDWYELKIFYPMHNTLAFSDHFYLHSLIGLPYFLLTGDPFKTYNCIFVTQILIAALGIYLLSSKVTDKPYVTFTVGAFFCLSPAFLNKHPQINFYGFAPFILYFLWEFLERRRVYLLYLALLSCLLQVMVGIYLQIFTLFFLGALLLAIIINLLSRKRLGKYVTRTLVPHYIISLLVLFLFLFLLNRPYLIFRSETGVERGLETINYYSPDAIWGYLLPFPKVSSVVYNPFSALAFQVFGKSPDALGRVLFLGYFVSLLLVVGLALLFSRGTKARNKAILMPSFAFLFAMYLFSLGPWLKILGHQTRIPLPFFYLWKFLFVFRAIRVPSRIIVLMSVPISLILACVLDEWESKPSSASGKPLLKALLVLLILLDIAHFRRYSDYSSIIGYSYVYSLVNQAEQDVLLELPSGAGCENLQIRCQRGCHIACDGYYEFFHIYHDKYTVNGYSGYIPPAPLEVIKGIDRAYADPEALKAIIEGNNIGLVLIHKRLIKEGAQDNFRQLVANLSGFMEKVFEDVNYLLLSRPSGGELSERKGTPESGLSFSHGVFPD